MNSITTEQSYPIQRRWIVKSILNFVLSVIFLTAMVWVSRFDPSSDIDAAIGLYIPFIIIAAIIRVLYVVLRRATFHYAVEEQFLTLRQGIIAKEQRHVPYGVIQNIYIKQDLFDRLFKLAFLTVETASQGAGKTAVPNKQRPQIESVGFTGNTLSIPGLAKDDAETLKVIILQKMKDHPLTESNSGL